MLKINKAILLMQRTESSAQALSLGGVGTFCKHLMREFCKQEASNSIKRNVTENTIDPWDDKFLAALLTFLQFHKSWEGITPPHPHRHITRDRRVSRTKEHSFQL